MMIIPGLFEVLSIFLLGGGFGLPLGIPPAAEDPAMARIAPKECMVYLTWSGLAKPDPKASNQTEQLLAEKEVQQSLKLLEEQIVDAIRAEVGGDRKDLAMVDDIRIVAKAVLTCPTAIYITKIEVAQNGPRDVRGGAMVNLGSQSAEIAQALGRIESGLKGAAAPKPTGAATWHRFPLGFFVEEGPSANIYWAVKGNYLIVGIGQGEADKIVARSQQEPPEWLHQLRSQLTVPRPANLIYFNIAGLAQIAGRGEPDFPKRLAALGLDQVQSLATITGLDDSGCISRTQVTINGEPKGLLSLLNTQPLTPEQLKAIPKDATIALAARLDVAKLYQELLATANRLEPNGQQELVSGVRRFEEQYKVKILEDILNSLGDAWRFYTSRNEGNLVFTGLTAVVDIRDHDRLVGANAKLVFGSLFGGMASEMTQPASGRQDARIKKINFGAQTIFYIKRLGDFMPFAPAWCITEKEFVFALYPQNVKAYLERAGQAASPSLADVAEVTKSMDSVKPIAVTYIDMPSAFKLAYPIAQIVLGFASGQMEDGGRGRMALDVSILPPAPSIGRHLRPTVSTVSRTKEGILIETRQTLPLGGVGGLSILPYFLLFAEEQPMHRRGMAARQTAIDAPRIDRGVGRGARLSHAAPLSRGEHDL